MSHTKEETPKEIYERVRDEIARNNGYSYYLQSPNSARETFTEEIAIAYHAEMNQHIIDKWSDEAIRQHFPSLCEEKKEWIVKAILANFKEQQNEK